MYDCFEQAIYDYSEQINQFRGQENISDLLGVSTNTNVQNVVASNQVSFMIRLADGYGAEVGVGGNIDWKKGYVTTIPGQQVYDLDVLWSDAQENGADISIKRIFHDDVPARKRLSDPFAMSGGGVQNLLGEFGWSGMGVGTGAPGTDLTMMPLHEDLLRLQGIEMNRSIRRSAYSFELINNKLRLMPVPRHRIKVYFDYILTKDRFDQNVPDNPSNSVITDLSNIPFGRIMYSNINDSGKNWIKRYALALMKETLGEPRSKYGNIPIADDQVSLNGAELKQEGKQEQEALITSLKETLEQTSKSSQVEKKLAEVEATQEMLKRIPMKFYTG